MGVAVATDGEINYTEFTRARLRDALLNIDAQAYPINFANLQRELASRPPDPPFLDIDSSFRVPLISDRGSILSCVRYFYLIYFMRKRGWQFGAGAIGWFGVALGVGRGTVLFNGCVLLAFALLMGPIIMFLLAYCIAFVNLTDAKADQGGPTALFTKDGVSLDYVSRQSSYPWSAFADMVDGPEAFILVRANLGSFVALNRGQFPPDLANKVKAAFSMRRTRGDDTFAADNN